MKFDYDLVIVGSTDEAVYAAKKAVKLKARVALLKQDLEGNNRDLEAVCRHTYHRFSGLSVRMQEYPFCWQGNSLDWLENSRSWVKELGRNLAEPKSSAILAALGIDVVEDEGEFVRLPQLGIKTKIKKRELNGRSYLLATGSHFTLPNIEGLSLVKYLDRRSLWQQDLELLPQNLLIISEDPIGLEIAQILHRLGKTVILVTDKSSLLPSEDTEIVSLLQAHLEASGITIYTSTQIVQIKEIESQKWVQIGSEALSIDEIIVTGKASPYLLDILNLQGVNISYNSDGVTVDRTLQTSNKRIYAVGSILGGYNNARIACHEVDIALKNALSSVCLFPSKTNYNYIPLTIATEPSIARVGMTETQAKESCGEKIQIVRRYLSRSIVESIEDRSPTFCKFILHDSGEILGAHSLGYRAVESIESIALAMRYKLNQGRSIVDNYF